LTAASASLAVLVAESDDASRQELAELLQSAGRVEEIAVAEDAPGCVRLLEHRAFDVLFLDVRLRGLGSKSAAAIAGSAPPHVVLLTEVDGYLADVFGTSVDCMVKPVRQDRLQLTLARLLGPLAQAEPPAAVESETAGSRAVMRSKPSDRLAVFTEGRIRLIAVERVEFAEVRDRRVYVYTSDERFETHLTLAEMEDRHRPQGFLRVHRQFVVNIHHIDTVEPFFNNTYLLSIRHRPSLRIPVSRRKSRELRELLHI